MRLFILIIVLLHQIQINCQSDTTVIIKEQFILFDSDKSIIRDDQIQLLDSFISIINKINFDYISVEGHTDQIGNSLYNKRLSEKRSLSIINYLKNQGISASKMNSEYFGEELLLSHNMDQLTLAQNRRVKINIYKTIKLQWLKGLILKDSLDQGIQAKVRIHSKYWEDTITTDHDGYFKLLAPRDKVVGIDIISEGFLLDMIMVKIKPEMANEALKIRLKEIAEGRKFDMKRLFFVGDQDILLTKSFNVLPVLEKFMTINKNTCIEIRGHINLPKTPKTKINTHYHDLSISRARRIYKYLIDKGIEENRMVYKGYGNWEMIHPNAKIEQERVQNRRVEAIIIDCEGLKSKQNDQILDESHFFEFKEQNYSKN